jgi:hypothetical protein
MLRQLDKYEEQSALGAEKENGEEAGRRASPVHTGMLIGIAEARIGITSFGRGVEAHDTLLSSIYIDRHGVQAS